MSITCTGRFHNGVVEIDQMPGGVVACPVLVTFLQAQPSADGRESSARPDALAALRRLFAAIPSKRSLSDELIAERRAEAGRE